MCDILYRKIDKKDYLTISDMIDSAFGLSRYISNKKILNQVKKMYLYSCLAEATFTNIAEKDGEIIGIIMGNSKSDYKLSNHLSFIIKNIKIMLYIKLFGIKDKKGIEGYRSLNKIYIKFLNKHKNEFNGVLTLFIVKDGYRGLGIGKTLLNSLVAYLKDNKVSNIYLYTDTTCNYMFYENNSFKRLEEENLMLIRDGKEFDMNVFLYGYRL